MNFYLRVRASPAPSALSTYTTRTRPRNPEQFKSKPKPRHKLTHEKSEPCGNIAIHNLPPRPTFIERPKGQTHNQLVDRCVDGDRCAFSPIGEKKKTRVSKYFNAIRSIPANSNAVLYALPPSINAQLQAFSPSRSAR